MPAPVILDLCGGSGSWSMPYREAGYDVRVVDPLVDGTDVRLMKHPGEPVHGILAAPPCEVFAVSGNRWQRSEQQVLDALSVVDACFRLVVVCRPRWWALENPVGKLRRYLGVPTMIYDPCDFGDPWTKRTCLWGEFELPSPNPVEPTSVGYILNVSSSPERAQIRAVTPPGFARAFFEANP